MPGEAFVNGLDFCERFYIAQVEPLIHHEYPNLAYSAALLGDGSEVLGFDTPMSTDHDWHARVLLFVASADHAGCASGINNMFNEMLPPEFDGFKTEVKVQTPEQFFAAHLGFDISNDLEPADWLTFPEQKLATITGGRMFYDGLALQAVRERFAYYPQDVWLYLLAAGWNRIGQEDHLAARAGYVGDELGSAIISARVVRDLMRLCFLMEKRYAPYPKWFGTAFGKLHAARQLQPLLAQALEADTWAARQPHLVEAYEHIAQLHNELKVTEPMPTNAIDFFDRPFKVVSLHGFAQKIASQITDPRVQAIAEKRLIGGVDQWSDSTDILSDPKWRPQLRRFYNDDK